MRSPCSCSCPRSFLCPFPCPGSCLVRVSGFSVSVSVSVFGWVSASGSVSALLCVACWCIGGVSVQ